MASRGGIFSIGERRYRVKINEVSKNPEVLYLKMEVSFELKMYFISRKKVFLDLPIGKEITNLVAMSTSDSQTTVSKYYFSQKEGRDGKKEENERGRKANPLHGEMTDSSSDTGNV